LAKEDQICKTVDFSDLLEKNWIMMQKYSSSKQNRKRRSKNDSSDEVGNKTRKIKVPSLNPMVFYPGFPHIAEKNLRSVEQTES